MTFNGLTDADHQALSRLVIEMVWRVDHGKGDTVHELWVEDGEMWFDGKPFAVGIEAIKEWGSLRLPPDSIRHLATNLRFEADGADGASGSGIELVFYADKQRKGPGATIPLVVGEWAFRFVRTAEGWRVAFIDFTECFSRREDPQAFVQQATLSK